MAPTDNDLLTRLNTAQIRMDSKLDNIISSLQRVETSLHDHEIRIRVIEPVYVSRAALRELEDALNRRIKEVDDKPTVSPGTMWKVAGVLGTALTFLFSVIAFLITTMK